MKAGNLIALLFAVFLFSACAHHRDVRPGADGVHRVVVQAEDDEGEQDAISQANHFCKERNQVAAFVDEKKSYTGSSMSEADYRKSKTASKVAQGVGGAAWVLGGKNESALGGIVGTGGSIARGAIGNGYTVEMRFKCQ
jgi:hypothetical protein